jgi:hypothetical protein
VHKIDGKPSLISVGESPYEYQPNRKICYLFYLKHKHLSQRVDGLGEYGRWNIGYTEGNEKVLMSAPCSKDTAKEQVPDEFTNWYIHEDTHAGFIATATKSVSSLCTKPPPPPTPVPTPVPPTLFPTPSLRETREEQDVSQRLSYLTVPFAKITKKVPYCHNIVIYGPQVGQRGFDLTGTYRQYKPRMDTLGNDAGGKDASLPLLVSTPTMAPTLAHPTLWQPSFSSFYRHSMPAELEQECRGAADCLKKKADKLPYDRIWLFYQKQQRIWAFGKSNHAAPYLAAVNSVAPMPQGIGGNGDGFHGGTEGDVSWDVPQVGHAATADPVFISGEDSTVDTLARIVLRFGFSVSRPSQQINKQTPPPPPHATPPLPPPPQT